MSEEYNELIEAVKIIAETGVSSEEVSEALQKLGDVDLAPLMFSIEAGMALRELRELRQKIDATLFVFGSFVLTFLILSTVLLGFFWVGVNYG